MIKTKDIILCFISFILGIITSFSFMVITENRIEAKNREQMIILEPNVLINITNPNENIIEFYVESTNLDGNEIENFNFEFEIPGKIINIKESSFAIKLGDCEYSEKENKLYSIIDIRCKSIMPAEWYHLNIDYKPFEKIYHYSEAGPTLAIPDYDLEIDSLKSKGFDKIFYHSADFNLKDFQEHSFYWLFNGNNIKKGGCKDLSEVPFIQKNNKEIINYIEGYLYLDSLESKILSNGEKGPLHECYQNIECLKDIEAERSCK